MKNLFYATRIDKNGNQLSASYLTQKNVDKYGGDNADHEVDIWRAEPSGSKLNITKGVNSLGMVVRGILLNNNPENIAESGNFRLWGKVNNEWGRTDFSFPTYGAANAMMKTLISSYQALAILIDGAAEEDEYSDDHSGNGRSVFDI